MGQTIKPRKIQSALLLVFTLFLLNFAQPAQAGHLSGNHSITLDPFSSKVVGEKVKNEILQFFHDAEMAIENEDLDGLMALYSDNYINGPHRKQSVKQIWKRIFSQMHDMATVHRMRFITTSSDSDVMIIRCSGLLMGIPEGEKNLITADTWLDSNHVLAKENGKWKLVGTTGKEHERFWFDKPMHPLF